MENDVLATIEMELMSNGELRLGTTGSAAFQTHLLSMGTIELLRRSCDGSISDNTLSKWSLLLRACREMIDAHGSVNIGKELLFAVGLIDLKLNAEDAQQD